MQEGSKHTRAHAPSLSTGAAAWRSAAAMLHAVRTHASARGRTAIALVAAGAVMEGAGLLMLVPILGVIVREDLPIWLDGTFVALGLTTPAARLCGLLAAFVLVVLGRAAILLRRDMHLARLQIGFIAAQRNGVMQALAAAPWERVAALHHARVLNLMSAEMQRIGTSLHFLIHSAVAAAMLAIQAALVIALAPELAVVLLAALMAGGALLALTLSRAHKLGGEAVHASQDLTHSAGGFLGGLKTAAAQATQVEFVDEFAGVQERLHKAQLRFIERQTRSHVRFTTLAAIAGGIVVLAAFLLLDVSPPVLIALVLILARMSGPALIIQQAAQSFFHGVAGFDAISALIRDLASGLDASPSTAMRDAPTGEIQLNGVSFERAGGGGVFAVDLRIEPGSFVGIAGASGAGKTTLIDLVTGLLIPQAGDIRIGGVPLSDENRTAWQRRIAYVAQDGFLFHESVRHNLSSSSDDDVLWQTLDRVGARGLVERLPRGLDTVIGDRGALLSGGERQRLVIARALLRDPALLVLDEATNALDASAEAAMLAMFAQLAPRPTILMVTHRAAALRGCNHVVRMDEGRVAYSQDRS